MLYIASVRPPARPPWEQRLTAGAHADANLAHRPSIGLHRAGHQLAPNRQTRPSRSVGCRRERPHTPRRAHDMGHGRRPRSRQRPRCTPTRPPPRGPAQRPPPPPHLGRRPGGDFIPPPRPADAGPQEARVLHGRRGTGERCARVRVDGAAGLPGYGAGEGQRS